MNIAPFIKLCEGSHKKIRKEKGTDHIGKTCMTCNTPFSLFWYFGSCHSVFSPVVKSMETLICRMFFLFFDQSSLFSFLFSPLLLLLFIVHSGNSVIHYSLSTTLWEKKVKRKIDYGTNKNTK